MCEARLLVVLECQGGEAPLPSPPAPLPKERGGERCRTGLSDGDPNALEDARRVVEDLTILEAQNGEPGGGEPVVA